MFKILWTNLKNIALNFSPNCNRGNSCCTSSLYKRKKRKILFTWTGLGLCLFWFSGWSCCIAGRSRWMAGATRKNKPTRGRNKDLLDGKPVLGSLESEVWMFFLHASPGYWGLGIVIGDGGCCFFICLHFTVLTGFLFGSTVNCVQLLVINEITLINMFVGEGHCHGNWAK